MNTPKTVPHTPIAEWEMRGLRISKERGPNASFILEAESKYPRVLVPVAFVTYKPHAEYFVDCVNSHDRLVKENEKLRAMCEKLRLTINPLLCELPEKSAVNGEDNFPFRLRVLKIQVEAEAALAASQPPPDR